MREYRENVTTPEGRELGFHLARLYETALDGRQDQRCQTCAFRRGDHLANGSPETLMTALKCAMERTPFWCHEADNPCAGWLVMRGEKGQQRQAPWECVQGVEQPE